VLTVSPGTFWLQAKAKLVQTMQQRNALEQDVQELQQKYAQKARYAQARAVKQHQGTQFHWDCQSLAQSSQHSGQVAQPSTSC
jgi:hypothetical protein